MGNQDIWTGCCHLRNNMDKINGGLTNNQSWISWWILHGSYDVMELLSDVHITNSDYVDNMVLLSGNLQALQSGLKYSMMVYSWLDICCAPSKCKVLLRWCQNPMPTFNVADGKLVQLQSFTHLVCRWYCSRAGYNSNSEISAIVQRSEISPGQSWHQPASEEQNLSWCELCGLSVRLWGLIPSRWDDLRLSLLKIHFFAELCGKRHINDS